MQDPSLIESYRDIREYCPGAEQPRRAEKVLGRERAARAVHNSTKTSPGAATLDQRSLHITRQGFWRGDPCRPVTVVDTPGLGGEDGKDDEVQTFWP